MILLFKWPIFVLFTTKTTLMKKLLFSSFVLLAMLAGTSCKKSKPAPSLTVLEQKLLGKWTWVKYEDFHIPADPSNDFVVDPMAQGAYMEFLGASTPNNLLYNEQGQQATANTWTPIDDNTFTASFIAPSPSFTITTATSTSLVFSNQTTVNGVQHIIRFTLSKP